MRGCLPMDAHWERRMGEISSRARSWKVFSVRRMSPNFRLVMPRDMRLPRTSLWAILSRHFPWSRVRGASSWGFQSSGSCHEGRKQKIFRVASG